MKSIELDRREEYLRNRTPGYRGIVLRYAPVRVLICIENAYNDGLYLEGLPQGVIAVGSVDKTFTVIGVNQRMFKFKRTQVPLTAGSLSSVYRAQGESHPGSPDLTSVSAG